MNPINVTGYDRAERAAWASDQFTQRPGGHRKMKIHLVTLHSVDSGKPERSYLVKAHTRAGAEKHVRAKLRHFIEAKVPTQDELVAALKDGITIEDATAQKESQE